MSNLLASNLAHLMKVIFFVFGMLNAKNLIFSIIDASASV